MTPAGVDRHLADLTGVSGWRGVIESRNILRSTLIVVCGLGGKTTGQAEAAEFARVALRALQRWQDLVNRVAGSAHRFAQDL
jgi:hypothetical protein